MSFSVALITVILLAILSLLFLNKRLFKDNLSPFNILTIAWTVPFLFSLTNLSELQNGYSFKALSIILSATIIQYFILTIRINKRTIIIGNKTEKITIFNECNIPKLIVVNSFCVIVVLICKIIAEFSHGIPLLVYLSGNARDADLHMIGKLSKLQIIADILPTCGAISFYCAIKSRKFTLGLMVSLAMTLLPILSGIFAANKFDIVKPIFFYTIILYYANPNFFSKNRIFITLLSIILLVSIFFVSQIRMSGVGYTAGYDDAIMFKKSELPSFLQPLSSFIAYPYGYICLNYENCGRFIDLGGISNAIGTSLLHPFLTITLNGDYVKEILKSINTCEVSTAANMGTYIRDLYMEGGYLFVILGATIYTLLIKKSYLMIIKRRNFTSLFIYSSFLIPWFWLNYCNSFSILTTFSNPIAGYLIIKISKTNLKNRHNEKTRPHPSST